MSDWTTSSGGGWGDSSSDNKGGWGDSSSGNKRGEGESSSDNKGGWGESSDGNKGGWGESSGGNNGGWGESSGGRRGGRGGSYSGGRGGRGGSSGGGRGGWGGSSSDNKGGWGESSSDNKGGWGDSSSDNKGGWGDSSSGNKGGWGDSSSDNRGGWGDSSGGRRGGRGGSSGGGRGGFGGSSGGGRGGFGGSSSEKQGGWGESSSDNKGGWGDSSSDNKGGWGESSGGNKGGWGESSGGGQGGGWSNDNNGDQDDQPKKRFKQEDESGEERPAPYKPEDLDLDEEAKLQGDGAGINFKKYDEQKVICLPPGSVTPIEKFEDVIKSELLLSNIKSQKYSGMTPIQKWSMPAILAKQDLIGCAQTGSGKTAAFLLPVLQDLLSSELEPTDPNADCQNPYCLIISPTRELARQISVHAGMLSRDSIIKCHVIYGQVATAHLKSRLSTGCHVLVATPGRLKDFVERGWIGFKNIRYMILDEGDRLCDDGFSNDIKGFFEHPTMPPKEERQTLFFSATFKDDIQMTAKEYLKNDFIFLTVGRIGAANEDIKQEFLKVSRQEKKRELKKILAEVPETNKVIVFTQTKIAADMLAGFFTALNLSSTSIHGDRHQSQREQAISAFKRGEKRFLISSPVGNRGLDLPKVSLVINYDLPSNIDEYVHRIGRTGRAGHTGRALSFYDDERDREILPQLIDILKEVKQEIPDWMQDDSSGFAAPTSGGLDSWDTAPATNSAGSDNWASETPADQAAAAASTDNWATPTKQASEETASHNNGAADSW